MGLYFDPDLGGYAKLTVDLGPYILGGRILDKSGQAFDGASVVVVQPNQNEDIRSRSTRRVTADLARTFRINGLGPGNHE